ncbi:MAG: VOC family protein [Pyrinomonadaceae bacterium]|nr:VOC family protein [Pyrinomonadaceae bacterium]
MGMTGLDRLLLEVNSLEESIAFYHEQLGFEIETSSPLAEPPMATLSAGRLKITLVQQLETMLRRGRGIHLFVGVTDIDAFYRELKLRQAEVQPPVEEGWGGRFVTLQDPDKYRFFFVEWQEAQPHA